MNTSGTSSGMSQLDEDRSAWSQTRTKQIDNDTLDVTVVCEGYREDGTGTCVRSINARFIGDDDARLRTDRPVRYDDILSVKSGSQKYEAFLADSARRGYVTVGDVTVPWHRVVRIDVTKRTPNVIHVKWV